MGLALAGPGGPGRRAGLAATRALGYGEGCLLVLGWEGAEGSIGARRRPAAALLRRAGLLYAGRGPGEAWARAPLRRPAPARRPARPRRARRDARDRDELDGARGAARRGRPRAAGRARPRRRRLPRLAPVPDGRLAVLHGPGARATAPTRSASGSAPSARRATRSPPRARRSRTTTRSAATTGRGCADEHGRARGRAAARAQGALRPGRGHEPRRARRALLGAHARTSRTDTSAAAESTDSTPASQSASSIADRLRDRAPDREPDAARRRASRTSRRRSPATAPPAGRGAAAPTPTPCCRTSSRRRRRARPAASGTAWRARGEQDRAPGTATKAVSAAASTGRRGIWRIAASAPISAPTPSAALSAPQTAGAAEIALGHERAEHAPRAPRDVGERRPQHEGPHPGRAAERGPALAQVLPEARGGALDGARDAHAGQQQRAGAERRRVDRERPARADRGHEHARERRGRRSRRPTSSSRARRWPAAAAPAATIAGSRPVEAGLKKPGGDPREPRQQRDAPHLRLARDDERRRAGPASRAAPRRRRP